MPVRRSVPVADLAALPLFGVGSARNHLRRFAHLRAQRAGVQRLSVRTRCLSTAERAGTPWPASAPVSGVVAPGLLAAYGLTAVPNDRVMELALMGLLARAKTLFCDYLGHALTEVQQGMPRPRLVAPGSNEGPPREGAGGLLPAGSRSAALPCEGR